MAGEQPAAELVPIGQGMSPDDVGDHDHRTASIRGVITVVAAISAR